MSNEKKEEKFGKHRHFGKELKRSIDWLYSLDEVQRIILTLSERVRHSYKPGTIRYCRDSPGGIYINAYDGNGITRFFLKTNNKKLLITKIQEKFK